MTTSALSPLRRRSSNPSVGAKSASIRAPPAPSSGGRGWCALGRGRFGGGGDGGDRLQDLRRDLVGVALRVRTPIFQVALVAVVDEAMGHADRSAAVGDTVGEGIADRGA